MSSRDCKPKRFPSVSILYFFNRFPATATVETFTMGLWAQKMISNYNTYNHSCNRTPRDHTKTPKSYFYRVLSPKHGAPLTSWRLPLFWKREMELKELWSVFFRREEASVWESYWLTGHSPSSTAQFNFKGACWTSAMNTWSVWKLRTTRGTGKITWS